MHSLFLIVFSCFCVVALWRGRNRFRHRNLRPKEEERSIARSLLVNVLTCIIFVSIMSFFSLMRLVLIFVSDDTKERLATVEFPLRLIQDVIVDGNDRVYVGIEGWARIQVYDRSGRFLYGFFSHSLEGAKLGFTDEGNLLVTHSRNSDVIEVFSPQGKFIERRTGGREYNRQWTEGRPCTRDSRGLEYRIRDPSIDPKIVAVAPDGTERVFLGTPWYLWPFVAPVPCLITVAVASIPLYLLSRKRHDAPEEPVEGFAKTWKG